MSKFSEIQNQLKDCLKNRNQSLLAQIFAEEPKMTIDAYLKDKYAEAWALRHFYTNDFAKSYTSDFLAYTDNLKVFLQNQDLFDIALQNVSVEHFVSLIKHSGLIKNSNWISSTPCLQNTTNVVLQNFYVEAKFLTDFYCKIEQKAQNATTWLNQVDWQTFWILFAYEFAKHEQQAKDPNNVRTDVQALFFMLQYKKRGQTNLEQNSFLTVFRNLNSEESHVKVGLLFQDVKNWKKTELEKLGYAEFQKCLAAHIYLSQAIYYLEQYCYTDNIAIDFAENNTVGRIYLKSVEDAINAQKDLLKYSLCSRYYNVSSNTPFENHWEASCLTSYFEDLGFDVKSELTLKDNSKICIETLADIIAGLRKGNSLEIVFDIISEAELLTMLQKTFVGKYSNEEILRHIDFITTMLPLKNLDEKLDLTSIPIFKLQNFYLFFPRFGALSSDFATGLLNLLWYRLANDEIKKVSDNQAKILKELFEKRGFKVIANEKIAGIEFDLVAYHDGVLLLIEMKSTSFHVNEKGIYLHQKDAIRKANKQILDRLIAVMFKEDFKGLRDRLGISENVCFLVPSISEQGKLQTTGFTPKTATESPFEISILPMALSTSFDFDHQLHYIDNSRLQSLKISYFELLVTLRNERQKLFNENRIREKIMMLMDKEPILADFNFEKLEKRANKFRLFEENETITGKDLWNIIWQDIFWGDWTNDNFDFIEQDYISPRKDMATICNNDKNTHEVVKKYNFGLECFEYGRNVHQGFPQQYIEDMIIWCSDLLKLFPNHTGALFHRGYMYQTLKEYNKAFTDYEKIFSIDLVEAIQPNPNLTSAFDGIWQVYIAQEEYQEAINFAEWVTNVYPKFYHGYLALENFERMHGDAEKAKEWKEIYLNSIPISDYPSRLKQSIYAIHNK